MLQENKALRFSPENVVLIFAPEISAVNEDRMAALVDQVYDMLENSSDAEISNTIRPQSSDERKAGKQKPLVEAFIARKMAEKVAKIRATEVSTVAKAFLPFEGKRWTPHGIIQMDGNGGTHTVPLPGGDVKGWHNVVAAARKVLQERTAIRSVEKADTKFATEYVKEQQRVAREHGVKLAELPRELQDAARDAVVEKLDAERESKLIADAAETAFNKVGRNRVQGLIDALAKMAKDYDTAQAQQDAEVTQEAAVAAEIKAAAQDAAAHAEERRQHAA